VPRKVVSAARLSNAGYQVVPSSSLLVYTTFAFVLSVSFWIASLKPQIVQFRWESSIKLFSESDKVRKFENELSTGP
jgi:hypothetical protein